MFDWVLVIFLLIGGHVEAVKYSVHQTKESCITDATLIADAVKGNMKPAQIANISIACVYNVDGTEI